MIEGVLIFVGEPLSVLESFIYFPGLGTFSVEMTGKRAKEEAFYGVYAKKQNAQAYIFVGMKWEKVIIELRPPSQFD